MKVVLYMTITPNGMIAPKDGRALFNSKASEKDLGKLAKKIGCVVYGKNSYDSEPIKNALNVVLTHDKNLKSDKKEFRFMSKEPTELLRYLEKLGYKEVLIIGGAKTNTEFADLIDEIYLNIEPLFFGSGVPLFAPSSFQSKLKLLETKKLSEQTVQLHYIK